MPLSAANCCGERPEIDPHPDRPRSFPALPPAVRSIVFLFALESRTNPPRLGAGFGSAGVPRCRPLRPRRSAGCPERLRRLSPKVRFRSAAHCPPMSKASGRQRGDGEFYRRDVVFARVKKALRRAPFGDVPAPAGARFLVYVPAPSGAEAQSVRAETILCAGAPLRARGVSGMPEMPKARGRAPRASEAHLEGFWTLTSALRPPERRDRRPSARRRRRRESCPRP